MTDARRRTGLTRRRFLWGAGAASAAAAIVAVSDRLVSSGTAAAVLPGVVLGSQPAGLPLRQHAWNDTLARDDYGNPVAPRFNRLLFFDVRGSPTPGHARVLEASLRTLERYFAWGPQGLLFTTGWAPGYFEHVVGTPSPIPKAKPLSQFELPSIDDYDLCLHFACDDEQRLASVEAALLHGTPLGRGAGQLDLSSALRWRETRTGFVGTGLPAARQQVGGIPPGSPVSTDSPLFMGFKSALLKNQATEDAVTIPRGAFAAGTTLQVSYMQLRLQDWYEQLSQSDRVARMYAPQVTPEQANRFTTDAKSDPNLLEQAIRRYSVCGHAQTSARARRNGRPVILRRDFDTVDGGQAGLHFVSLQRTIDDFVRTRTAMNASEAQLQNPAITDTVNNGINEFIFVRRRANYVIPSRRSRSFPLLPGREQALT